MLIKNKKPFSLGVAFAMTFIGVLIFIFSPMFGGKNGLQFADDSFNRLAKGSSYFIPKVQKDVEKYAGKPLAAKVKVDEAEQAENTAKLFQAAGAQVTVTGQELQINGDMGAVLGAVLRDSDAMFKNDGAVVSARYGYDEKQAMKNWWAALGKMEKNFKKEMMIPESKMVGDVMRKGIEPGYNFYHIEENKVSEHAGMLSGLLIFYVLYTMWWGYAIFFMFEGLGLSMKKAKVKKEA